MVRALELARHGWGQTAPNPMVGAVVVREGRVVGEGFHARYGGAHAEAVALRSAGEQARGAELYVTLEPCTHAGKTPPCVGAIVAAGMARVVIAARDPSPVARGGVGQLRAAGIDVEVGPERDAAVELNAPFFHALGSDVPWVTLKLAVSAEGAIAGATRAAQWLSGGASRREVHHLRAGSDAIAVGIGTVLADDPALTVREVPAPRVAPTRIVFDSSLRIPLEAQLVRTARDVETIVVARGAPAQAVAALRDRGVTVIDAASLRDALVALRAREVRSLLIEGGAGLAASLVRESLAHRIIIFQTTAVLGDGALPAFGAAQREALDLLARAPVVERRTLGNDVMTVYALQDVACSPD
jgi:diaminohydroxyphosphoribosylaminopyrimidine deaminase/5-amino-6-(5-phosphoribosylamino)uracil reductase